MPHDPSPPALLAEVRRARTADVPGIRALVDANTAERRLLEKATVTLYEDVQEFFVAVDGDRVVGCGALHVLWEDLAEVRTLAVAPAVQGRGIGAALLSRLVENARDLGVRRLFCLTFEVDFFARHGFVPGAGGDRRPGACRRRCSSRPTRASPSSSTSSGSSRTPSATRGCSRCCRP